MISLKQTFLQTLIGALVLSALVGIYTFLFGDFGETEVKILLTTLSVSYFSVTLLACAAAHEKRKPVFITQPGLAVGIAGLLLYVPGIWAEWWDSEPFVKSMAIVGIFAFSFAQICLLSFATLQANFRWTFFAAITCIFALAALLAGMIIFETDEQWLVRMVGVFGILDGCASLSIPVLSRLAGSQSEEPHDNSFTHIELVCPRCQNRGEYTIGGLE